MNGLSGALFSVSFALVLLSGSNAELRTFFRKDYTYLEQTRSFYKFHTVARTWQEARKRCSIEGASLFYPKDTFEADTVMTFWNNTQPFYYAFIGISDSVVKGVFETIDGLSVSEVYDKWGPGEPNDAGGKEGCVVLSRLGGLLNDDQCGRKFPFICRKTQDSLKWNNDCDLPDLSYKYSPVLNACYKFHIPANWTDAYTICRAEQSYLAVINSQAEADHLVKLVETAPKIAFKWDYYPGIVYLGFHSRVEEDGWKTITGQPLHESGYSKWGSEQPDGGDKEKCGAMFYSGDLNDMSCENRCHFICEHELGDGSETFDERFGTD